MDANSFDTVTIPHEVAPIVTVILQRVPLRLSNLSHITQHEATKLGFGCRGSESMLLTTIL